MRRKRASKKYEIDDWSYTPLSEPRVVAALLIHRDEYEAGQLEVDSPVRLTYLALDELIACAGLTLEEAEAVALADYSAKPFAKAVAKIVAANNERWGEVYACASTSRG